MSSPDVVLVRNKKIGDGACDLLRDADAHVGLLLKIRISYIRRYRRDSRELISTLPNVASPSTNVMMEVVKETDDEGRVDAS